MRDNRRALAETSRSTAGTDRAGSPAEQGKSLDPAVETFDVRFCSLEPVAARRYSGRSVNSIVRQRRRVLVYGIGCVAVLAVLATVTLVSGEIAMPVPTALSAALGMGDAGDVYVVQQFRAPRLVAGVIAGAGLAVAGAILQRLFRNPLASPDVMGVTGGASLGVVLILAFGASQAAIPFGALAGGVLAGVLLILLGSKAGLPVARLVLVGLAVQAGLQAAVNLFVVRFPRELASSATQWTVGSLYGRTWTEVQGAALALAVVLVLAFVQYRTLATLDLGDESAGALGISVPSARLRLLMTAVVLASLAAAIAGPITFVALAVPQLVRMLVGPPSALSLFVTGLAGAVLLVGCDLVAQHVSPVTVPVGIVTATIGAPWLLILMLRESSPAHRRTA
ncbi:FecCD family ABC transporter permease [Nocardia huaxiensis]|uniref:FecCD family ABC transporter permease n=1 Tax=Nocardia huaxiensis TaxID=2755382 RepID=UPI001E4FA13E|nr:iron ABC transporter permease [Nocardia huaxiensis]UFS95099.1 iron ABC transporter permease [Nocardia huaxiensis]